MEGVSGYEGLWRGGRRVNDSQGVLVGVVGVVGVDREEYVFCIRMHSVEREEDLCKCRRACRRKKTKGKNLYILFTALDESRETFRDAKRRCTPVLKL